MYKCVYCNFETNDSGNYCSHKQTKKHQENIKNNYSFEKENENLKSQIKEMINYVLS